MASGIQTGGTSTVSNNTSYENGGDQIETGGSSGVFGNTVRVFNSTGWGLNLTNRQTGYRNNVISNNGGAGTVNSGTDAGGNLCNGSTTCP